MRRFPKTLRTRPLPISCSTLLAFLSVSSLAVAEERQWDAKTLFTQSVASDVRLTDDGSFLELDRGDLIEDDGPAAGYSYQSNDEVLSKDVWIRKQLQVEDPRTDGALLLIGLRGSPKFQINGSSRDLSRVESAENYWQLYSVPPEYLKAGTNEIVLHGEGTIWIARDEDYATGSRTRVKHPNRSAKSIDGGKTWDDQNLGRKGDIDGEYYVRLFLDRYHREGTITSPIVDLGRSVMAIVGPPVTDVGPVRVRLQTEFDEDGEIDIRMRSGKTPVLEPDEWTDWQPIPSDGVIEKPRGRYVQLALTLKTSDPRKSPRLKSVTLECDARTSGIRWTDQLNVVDSHNETIVRSSIPFEYESFDHPALGEFRKRYQLDDVVAGAASEFDMIRKLAAWSATRWDRLRHLSKAYPPWNALEILKLHEDGTPVGGFCQQYNLVFLQACESFGLIGRAVSLGPGGLAAKMRGGHEVVEIWSNDFKKWIYVDGNFAWYIVDEKTNVPLSLWELRQRQLAAFREEAFPPVRLERIVDTGMDWELKGKPPFVELRLIPRSNFLSEKSPLPLNQGMRGWFWTGHHAWTDALMPVSFLYSNRVTNRHNWEWTLNQTRYALEATETPGAVRVHLETETPEFDGFFAVIDEAKPMTVRSGFIWTLHPGKNRLRVASRNKSGREGIASWIVLESPE